MSDWPVHCISKEGEGGMRAKLIAYGRMSGDCRCLKLVLVGWIVDTAADNQPLPYAALCVAYCTPDGVEGIAGHSLGW